MRTCSYKDTEEVHEPKDNICYEPIVAGIVKIHHLWLCDEDGQGRDYIGEYGGDFDEYYCLKHLPDSGYEEDFKEALEEQS